MTPRTTQWRCGWSPDSRRFYFRLHGSRIILSGPKVVLRRYLRKLLPVWREVAVADETTPAAFLLALDHEIAALGPQ